MMDENSSYLQAKMLLELAQYKSSLLPRLQQASPSAFLDKNDMKLYEYL